MNVLLKFSPLIAIGIAQTEVPSQFLTVYGPLGVICAWLMFRDERRAKEAEKLRQEIGNVAHQMKGLNRNLLYQAASHGPQGLREMAQAELSRDSNSGA